MRPEKARNSRIRCAWSAYPHERATAAQSTRPIVPGTRLFRPPDGRLFLFEPRPGNPAPMPGYVPPEVAEQRDLTPEELADRLVPDLGLDADGSLTLDFGPRAFRVGFDGSLRSIGASPFADHQTAPCWVEISHDGRFLFAVNTAQPSISSFAINRDGSLTSLGATQFRGNPTGLGPVDPAARPGQLGDHADVVLGRVDGDLDRPAARQGLDDVPGIPVARLPGDDEIPAEPAVEPESE